MKKSTVLLIFIGILLIISLFYFISKEKINYNNKYQLTNLTNSKKCVPENCCHARNCVLEENAPNCSNIFCTMSCESGTMDCGAGYCEFVNGKCEVIWNE